MGMQWTKMDGERRQGERETSEKATREGDYRETNKERNPGSESSLGYPRFTVILPRFPYLSSTHSLATSYRDAIQKNEWSEEPREREKRLQKSKQRMKPGHLEQTQLPWVQYRSRYIFQPFPESRVADFPLTTGVSFFVCFSVVSSFFLLLHYW